ncbi:MAG: flagellin [Desulfomonilia bacterium]
MALRINTNIAALNAHRQLLGTESKLNLSMEKLSSGFRINRASDDAAGLAIANRLRANVRSLTVASRNVTEGKALLQIAEGSANQIESILERMKELATQAASANAGEDGDKLDAEFQSLKEEIDRIVADTNYQEKPLLDGSFAGTFQVGSFSSGQQGGSSQIAISINVGGSSGTGLDTEGLGIDDLAIGDAEEADEALATINTAINHLADVLGGIGAGMNRLEYTYSNLQVQIENFSASESAIRDVDMAAEIVNFTKNQILLQAGTAMLAQANMSTQSVLSLFG